jgi:hypothetical protein
VKYSAQVTFASEIAERADAFKAGFIGLELALPPLLHPDMPLLSVYENVLRMPRNAPVEVHRHDGTIHSDQSIDEALRRVTALPGGGFGGDLLPLAAMQGATRLGDDLQQARLYSASDPLLQFARHFRNACAHGNRWHFQHGEPRHVAALRDRQLDASLHGSRVLFDWVAPGDYLDFLDDLAALLRQVVE